jgi:succinate-acetate transporter protein
VSHRVATPLPLGFLALCAGTLLVSGLQLGWLAPADGRQVALILLAFVFPLQLLASVLGFIARDVTAGTGMGILAGTWLSIALVTLTAPRPGATSAALGLFLVLAGAAMLVPFSVALAGKLAAAAVLGTTAVRFAVTGAFQLTDAHAVERLAGVVGLVLLAVALYAAAAFALEEGYGRPLLPTGRR